MKFDNAQGLSTFVLSVNVLSNNQIYGNPMLLSYSLITIILYSWSYPILLDNNKLDLKVVVMFNAGLSLALLAYKIRFDYFNQDYCFIHSKPPNHYHLISHAEDLFSHHSWIIYVALQGRIISLGHSLKLSSLLLCFFSTYIPDTGTPLWSTAYIIFFNTEIVEYNFISVLMNHCWQA